MGSQTITATDSVNSSLTGLSNSITVAGASIVPTFFNTGVNSSGVPLADGTIGDPHYTLVSVPSGSTTAIRVRTSAGGYPVNGAWLGDDTLSAWIGPDNDPYDNGPAGDYDYRTTFDLTGYSPATASITGEWAVDDDGVSILLNGVSTGNSDTIANAYATFQSFSITSGFQAGLNTLDFIVQNAYAPTGLRVEATLKATALPPPIHFTETAPSQVAAGTPFNVTVTAENSNNTPDTGYTGTVHFTSGDSQALLPVNATLANGVGIFVVTLKTAGGQTLTVTDTANAGITATSGTITVDAAAATHFGMNFPATVGTGVSFAFTVIALDQFNNVASAYHGTVGFTSSDSHGVLPANSTLTNGTGTFSATFQTVGSQMVTATDIAASTITGTATVIVSENAVTHFAVSAPAAATSGTPVNFTVTALNADNTVDTAYQGTLAFSSTDSLATLPPNTTSSYLLYDDGPNNSVLEYTTSGTLVNSFTVPPTPSDDGPLRGLAIDANGNVAIYNGTFSPYLSTLSLATGTLLNNSTYTGWDTVGSSDFGGAAAYGNYVFVTGAANIGNSVVSGLFRFNINDHSVVNFSIGDDAVDVTIGRDGLLYEQNGAGSPAGDQVKVFNPTTLALLRTISLSQDQRAIAVDSNGDIYAVGLGYFDYDNNDIYEYSGTGTVLRIIPTPFYGYSSIAIDGSGQIVAVSGNNILVTNTSFSYFNTFTVPGSGGGFVGWVAPPLGVPLTLTNGVGTFSATLRTSGNQQLTVTDTSNSANNGTSNVLSVSATAATSLAVTTPAGVTAGTPFNVTVTALDPYGNTATSFTGTIHLASKDSRASLPANFNLVGGVAVVSVTLAAAGNQTLSAVDTTVAALTTTSSVFTVTAATAARFAFSSPGFVAAGRAFFFTVTAEDAFGNKANGYNGTITFTSSDAAAVLPGHSTLTAGLGIFSATLNTAGSQTLTATDTVATAIAGISGSIGVSTAATRFVLSAPAGATVGAPFPLTVTALDASNRVAAGYAGTIHFSTNAGSAVLPANATLSNGIGVFSASLSATGVQSVTVADTLSSLITGSIVVTVSALAATHFAVSGFPANIVVGQPFTCTVTALDQNNNTATGYNGTVQISNSALQLLLPPNSTLTGGVGVFSATLGSTGTTTLTAKGAAPSGANFVQASGSPFNAFAPSFLVAGDFNGDGNLDFLEVSSYYSDLSILLGNGNGTFADAGSYNVGPNPIAAAVGDFTGDGKLDLAVTDYGNNTVAVLLGNGNGTFGPTTFYSVGSGPYGITVGDFSNNGKLDLVTANYGGANLSVLMGNGNGTFAPAVNVTAGHNPTFIAQGDFNNDGNADLAVVNSADNTVGVLLGNGNGTFGPMQNDAVGLNPFELTLGDFGSAARSTLP